MSLLNQKLPNKQHDTRNSTTQIRGENLSAGSQRKKKTNTELLSPISNVKMSHLASWFIIQIKILVEHYLEI